MHHPLIVLLVGDLFGPHHIDIMLLVSDLFGPHHLDSNFLFFDGMSLAVSEVVYESYTMKDDICIGEARFGTTHWITCRLCITMILSCTLLLLTKQTRQAYTSYTTR